MTELRARHAAMADMSDAVPRGRALMLLLREAWREYQRDYARYFASAMVYYFLISLVPLLLLLLAFLGLLLRLSNTVAALREQALNAIDAGFGTELRVGIEKLLQGMEQQSIVAVVVSLLALAFTASKVMRHLRMSFRAIWKFVPPLVSGTPRVAIRKALTEKAIAFGMIVTGVAVVLAGLAFLGVVSWVGNLIGAQWLPAVPPTVVIVPATFLFLLRYLPPVRLPWRHVWTAAMLCASAFLVGLELIMVFGAFVGSNVSAYGAIGAVLVVMLWMNAVCQLLFYGAEVCKVTHWWADGAAPDIPAEAPA